MRNKREQRNSEVTCRTTRFSLERLSLVLGVILTILNIVLFYFQYRAYQIAVRADSPRFDVLYYELDDSVVYSQLLNLEGERNFNHPTLGKPIVIPSVLPEFGPALSSDAQAYAPSHSNSDDTMATEISTFVLSIRNIGSRRAARVKVFFHQFTSRPNDPIGVLDFADLYRLNKNREKKEFILELPDLVKDSGVLIPIFTQATFLIGEDHILKDQSEAIVGNLLVPQFIEFYDDVQETTMRVKVRKMLDTPIFFRAGVSIRG